MNGYQVAQKYASLLRAKFEWFDENGRVLTRDEALHWGLGDNILAGVVFEDSDVSLTGDWSVRTSFGDIQLCTEEEYNEWFKGFHIEPWSDWMVGIYKD